MGKRVLVVSTFAVLLLAPACAESGGGNALQGTQASGVLSPSLLAPIVPAEIGCAEVGDGSSTSRHHTITITGSGKCELKTTTGQLAAPPARACTATSTVHKDEADPENESIEYQIKFGEKQYMTLAFHIDEECDRASGTYPGEEICRGGFGQFDGPPVLLNCGFFSGGGKFQ